jgi:hypothetical protein
MASWNFIRRCQSNQIQTFTAYSLSTRGPARPRPANALNLPQPAPKPNKPAPIGHYPDVKRADTDAAYARSISMMTMSIEPLLSLKPTTIPTIVA